MQLYMYLFVKRKVINNIYMIEANLMHLDFMILITNLWQLKGLVWVKVWVELKLKFG